MSEVKTSFFTTVTCDQCRYGLIHAMLLYVEISASKMDIRIDLCIVNCNLKRIKTSDDKRLHMEFSDGNIATFTYSFNALSCDLSSFNPR